MAVDSKKIHRHLQAISRINTTLALFSLVAVVVLFAWLRFDVIPNKQTESVEVVATTTDKKVASGSESQKTDQDTMTAAQKKEATTELTDNYRTKINSLLAGYNFDSSSEAEMLLYQVLELRVPAELKQMHLQVVLALNQSQQGSYDDAALQISVLKDQFAWFLPE